MENPISPERCCCCDRNNAMDFKKYEHLIEKFPLSEYQVEYNKEYVKKCAPINRRFVAAGIPSKGKPECQPPDYDSSEGIIPHFRGESTSRSTYHPQPLISQLKSSKPSGESKPPILLGPEMMEVNSYSNSVHSPMPLELARKTAQSIPLWIQQKLKPPPYETRYDLTSSYQADYCGAQTKPRRICLTKPDLGDKRAGGDCCNTYADSAYQKNQIPEEASKEWRTWNYINSLLYRTTTGSTYQPPSVHGEPICHPTKYLPNDDYLAGGMDKVKVAGDPPRWILQLPG